MKKSDFYYDLPKELIAQTPIEPRDHSRLLVYYKANKEISHKHFYDIVDYLHEGDVLVVNNTKVLPCRLLGKKDTGANVEVFIMKLSRGDDLVLEDISDEIMKWLLNHKLAKKIKLSI